MDGSIPLIWYVAISVAFGLLLGYALGRAIGAPAGKQELLGKIKLSLSREKIDLDLDRMLRN